MRLLSFFFAGAIVLFTSFKSSDETQTWIRINHLGYKTTGIKQAVWCTKTPGTPRSFQLVDAVTHKTVFKGRAAATPFPAYGPFTRLSRLDFSSFKKPGKYYLQTGNIISPTFEIADNVYQGAADFCLRYMRQQRSGYNPFLKDSCHTHDGYTLYGPMPDSTHINVSGGWHDATDYLQYVTTSANATYHLLAAYRDFPKVFADGYQSNGLDGRNGTADVLDEARWGLDWLLKMHPRADWMFNQVADDRDHKGMRLPGQDPFYGKGFERPIYFCTGQPQGLGKYKNRTTGTASTAGKFSSAFALGYQLFKERDKNRARKFFERSLSAYASGLKKPGVCQTAPCVSPYFYEEDNWVDDMELAAAEQYNVLHETIYREEAYAYAHREKITPWLGQDTARHYQWYPFVNLGHAALIRQLEGDNRRQEVLAFYKDGIDRVWQKAKQNGFYRGIPFIWCSNNLTAAFAIQCYWYRTLSHDTTYAPLEQACFDWLFGCNPWGTSFVFGLPAQADTPTDPHSSFTHLHNYPIDGGLVDGPVYESIYENLRGITLSTADAYATFQSELAVYHDDFGDYATNEPTMDGTASLIYLLAANASNP